MIRSILFLLIPVMILFSCKKNEPGQQQQGNGNNTQCRVQTVGDIGSANMHYYYDSLGRLIAFDDPGLLALDFQYKGDSVFGIHDSSLLFIEIDNSDGYPVQVWSGSGVMDLSYSAPGMLSRLTIADTMYANDPYTIVSDIVYDNGDVISFTVYTNQAQHSTGRKDTNYNVLTYIPNDLYHEYDPMSFYVDYGFLFGLYYGPLFLFKPQIFSKHYIDTWTWSALDREVDFDYVLNSDGRAERVMINDSPVFVIDLTLNINYQCF